LNVAEAGLGKDANPDCADQQQKIPGTQVARPDRRLRLSRNVRWQPREKLLSQRDVRGVAQLPWRREASDGQLKSHEPRHPCRDHEVRERLLAEFNAADACLGYAGGGAQCCLGQASRKSGVPQLVGKLADELTPAGRPDAC
jgi:hypothetical protein